MRSILQNIALATLSLLGVTTEPQAVIVKEANPKGCDVSNHQGSLNWTSIKSKGRTSIPTSTGTTSGATNNKIIRGAYHFAHPGTSTGAAQADYFLAHGGGWSADGITLPGAIDLEGNCSGLTAPRMVSWIKDFSNTYHSKTKRQVAILIYTTTSWWKECTGNSAAFGSTSPLWIAHWASSIGTLPAGWRYTTFWQYADSGPFPGDQDLFNGDAAGLKRLALGS
ncbi:glycoside hydrolase superfamily [Lactarius quietus]|nr:glycoside hydrolase superfamily [Lactarius quietus]